jgi:hypothetical protein
MGVKFDLEVVTGLANITDTNYPYGEYDDQGALVDDVRGTQSVPEVADLVWLYLLAYRLEPIIHDICSKS